MASHLELECMGTPVGIYYDQLVFTRLASHEGNEEAKLYWTSKHHSTQTESHTSKGEPD